MAAGPEPDTDLFRHGDPVSFAEPGSCGERAAARPAPAACPGRPTTAQSVQVPGGISRARALHPDRSSGIDLHSSFQAAQILALGEEALSAPDPRPRDASVAGRTDHRETVARREHRHLCADSAPRRACLTPPETSRENKPGAAPVDVGEHQDGRRGRRRRGASIRRGDRGERAKGGSRLLRLSCFRIACTTARPGTRLRAAGRPRRPRGPPRRSRPGPAAPLPPPARARRRSGGPSARRAGLRSSASLLPVHLCQLFQPKFVAHVLRPS